MVNRTQKGKEEIEITSIDKIPYEVLVVGFTIVIVVFAEILFSIFSSLNDIPINLVIGGLVGTYLVIYISLLCDSCEYDKKNKR